ncbi:MAG: hypothetical protein KF688_12820 [Pirellulales bacterium]|nr:hypothetical protein [Pirellulales bacterium]
MIRGFALVCCLLVGLGWGATSSLLAAPALDASNNVGGNSAALSLRPSNFWAQSFTVATDGLLSQIDVQLGKFAGAAGDVTLELRPLVGGLPAIDDKSRLFNTVISINDVPVINSLADPPPFVSVDLSSAGIHAKSGEQYAISMRRSGGDPVAAWRSKPNSYPGGTGFFRNLLNIPWSASVEELGFQTWIDPTPSTPYKYRVDATYDVQYRPGAVSSMIEGETALVIGGFPGDLSFPEQRPIMEFSLAGLPAGAVVQGAYLDLDFYVSSGAPRIEIVGFAGDGIPSLPDGTTPGTLLAVTDPTSAASSGQLPLNHSFIASLVGQATHAGVRLRSLDLPQYVGFTASDSTFSTSIPPRLVVEYTLPGLQGDFNDDEIVDGADFLVWQRGYPGTYGAEELAAWQAGFGSAFPSASAAAAVPEPMAESAGLIAVICAAGTLRSSLRAR